MGKTYSIGGDGPKPLKAPGAIKRLFTNKDEEKYNSGESNDLLDTKKKTYTVRTGNTYQKDTGKTKTTRYEISPAVKGTPAVEGKTTYTPELAHTTSKEYGNTSPERQAAAQKEAEGKNTPFQNELRKAQQNKQDTFKYTDRRGTLDYKAGTTTKEPGTPATPDKEAVYGEKKEKIYEATPEERTMKYGQGSILKPKKVSNVADMFKGGYDNKSRKNILNRQK